MFRFDFQVTFSQSYILTTNKLLRFKKAKKYFLFKVAAT